MLRKILTDKRLSVIDNFLSKDLENTTLTSTIREISEDTEISEPTVRRTLQELREIDLIEFNPGKSIDIPQEKREVLKETLNNPG